MKALRTYLTHTRITGLSYLGLALTGVFVLLFARAKLFVDHDALATTANLVQHEALARTGIAVEILLVGFQALAAVWFYKIFARTHAFAAGLIAVFGMVNAVAILIATGMWLGALTGAIGSEPSATVYGLFSLHESLWVVGGLFFGLWLIPMGYAALRAKLPRALAWFLMWGGVGYILSTLMVILAPNLQTIADLLVMPATIGEFWMVGYLLAKSKIGG